MGFAAETDDVAERAGGQAARPRGSTSWWPTTCPRPEVGFDHDTNAVTILGADGSIADVALTSKVEVADAMLDSVGVPLPPGGRSVTAGRGPIGSASGYRPEPTSPRAPTPIRWSEP